MQKDFDQWNEQKKYIHFSGSQKFFQEREVWWCALGLNIGREQSGRGDNFERPVVIAKKLSPDTFLGVPLGTKKRIEKFQILVTTHHTKRGFALADQIRVCDKKRLIRKIGTISREYYEGMKSKLRNIV